MDIQEIRCSKEDWEWMRDHSDPFGFADVNCPEDLVFAEWVLSGSYSLRKFVKEARELDIPLEKLIWIRFREWKNDSKREQDSALPRKEKGEGVKEIQESQSCCKGSQGYHG